MKMRKKERERERKEPDPKWKGKMGGREDPQSSTEEPRRFLERESESCCFYFIIYNKKFTNFLLTRT